MDDVVHGASLRKVLFVCLGNICRSPAGEGVFKAYAARHDRGLVIDSAGTIGIHAGKPADARMRSAAAARGYDLTSRSRQVTRQDMADFDLVVAMDRSNYDDLLEIDPSASSRVRMLGSFLPEGDGPLGVDVPDPYYGGPDGFETVLDMIESACSAIMGYLQQRQAVA